MLLCRLLYVPVQVRRVWGFTTYLPAYRGGVRERPVSFPVTSHGFRLAQMFRFGP